MLFAWKHPRVLVEQVLGWGLLCGLLYWWLGLAESSISQLLLSAGGVLVILAVLVLLVGRIRRMAAASPVRPALVPALVTLGGSILLAWWLVWWIPPVQGLRMQMISAALRFGVAYLLLVTFWVDLVASAGSTPRSAQPSTAASPN